MNNISHISSKIIQKKLYKFHSFIYIWAHSSQHENYFKKSHPKRLNAKSITVHNQQVIHSINIVKLQILFIEKH